jgi:putative endonuclease
MPGAGRWAGARASSASPFTDDCSCKGERYRAIHFSVGGWVYIMTNRKKGTLYVGGTSDLPRRAWEHRTSVVKGFTTRYALKRLVYAEHHDDIGSAIAREKVLKHWPRLYKVRLIEAANSKWDDLYDQLA